MHILGKIGKKTVRYQRLVFWRIISRRKIQWLIPEEQQMDGYLVSTFKCIRKC